VVPEYPAFELLRSYQIPTPACGLATSAEQAAEIARSIDAPVAVKIASRDVPHRSDIGAVLLGVVGDDTVRAAYECVVRRTRAHFPHAAIDGVSLAAMAPPDGVELIVGIKRDSTFGPAVIVGIGGVLAELLNDVAVLVPPFSRLDVEEAIDRLRGAKLLAGVRDAKPVNRDALINLVISVANIAVQFDSEIVSLDINPVLAYPDGVLAVDCLLELQGGGV
jgi:acetyltransferase